MITSIGVETTDRNSVSRETTEFDMVAGRPVSTLRKDADARSPMICRTHSRRRRGSPTTPRAASRVGWEPEADAGTGVDASAPGAKPLVQSANPPGHGGVLRSPQTDRLRGSQRALSVKDDHVVSRSDQFGSGHNARLPGCEWIRRVGRDRSCDTGSGVLRADARDHGERATPCERAAPGDSSAPGTTRKTRSSASP